MGRRKKSEAGSRGSVSQPAQEPFNPALREAALRATPQPRAPAPQAREAEPLGEAALFAQAMAGVEPLRDRRARVLPEPAPPPEGFADPDADALAELADLVAGAGAFDITDSDEFIEGTAPGVGPDILRRLRKGDFAVRAHLDLHGLTAGEARGRLESFLGAERQRGARCVLVVHGRGLHSKDQVPVLKERIKVWLSRGRVAKMVLAFASARPVDGGTGAVYVLLRR